MTVGKQGCILINKMKYTITDLRSDFPDDAACLRWLVDYLHPDGIFCDNCQKVTPHHAMKTRKSYSCETCGHHVHPTSGTIFHKSSTPLTLWFEAIFLITATRSGVSAKQLERTLGVTYKTAWRMFHQIRSMMGDDGKPFDGEPVEVDEMYMHPDPTKNTRVQSVVNGKGVRKSEMVFGMVERGGKAKVVHMGSNHSGKALIPEIQKSIPTSVRIYSDNYQAYKSLYYLGYSHKSINHSQLKYVAGDTHTQNIENLWSNMKRGIKGVYRHVDAQYLQAYVDEYAFRYSHRKSQSMFWALMNRVEN